MTHIRTIAICVIQNEGSLFLMECYDSVKKETYYRPLGGGIDFGERGEQAVQREFKEEIGADLKNLNFITSIENLYTLEGKPGHEIVLVFKGEFADPSFYGIQERSIIENGVPCDKAVWKPLREFQEGKAPLYPEGLLELLTTK
jgi:8-oxo-dGTP pyrophosphatase MutT (NUDIX family)